MKLQRRNLTKIWYCLFKERANLYDDDGYETGEPAIKYEKPESLKCSVSAAKGNAQVETFGNLESYDKVIITDKMDCPIDENSVLFVDKEPEFFNGKPIGYDYKVIRIAKSLNLISIAISKVKIT